MYIGTQAAELAEQNIYWDLSTPGSLGIVNPNTFKLAINTDTAEKLGLELKSRSSPGKAYPQIIVYP